MADRRHWAAGAGVGAAVAALLMTGLTSTALGSAFDGPEPLGAATASRGAAVSTSSAVSGPPGASAASGGATADAGDGATATRDAPLALPYVGAFTDSGAEGVRNLAGLSQWLGGAPVLVGHTYLPGGTWQDIEGDQELLQPWADWRRADPRRLFVLNVPMQARNEAHLSDAEVRGLIRQGAAGDFDAHFTRLAEHLVASGVPDTVVVLGWEMNGTTYTHRCAPDPEGWKAYWNRVVAAMRAVPGQRFRFDFAPSRGRDAIGWTDCYPGDAVVDIIGMDSYDQPPGEDFAEQVSQPYGLQAQVDFAALHGKEVSYPEWGLFRNGDDPDYVARMLRWMSDHKALYQTVTDYCPHGVWQCDENPRSSEVFRTMLSAPRPSASPSPSASLSASPIATPPPTVSPTPPATSLPAAAPVSTATPVVTAPTPSPTAPTPSPTATPAPTVPETSSPPPTVTATPTVTPTAPPAVTPTSPATAAATGPTSTPTLPAVAPGASGTPAP